MWEMGLDKYTPMQVAQYNNSLGIRNNEGKDWTDADVRDFYRKAAYRGATVRGRKQKSTLIPNGEPLAVCENAHQAMVTPEKWYRVNGYIAERHRAPAGPRSHGSLNLLSGRIFLRALRVTHARPHEHRRQQDAYMARRRSSKAKTRARPNTCHSKPCLAKSSMPSLREYLPRTPSISRSQQWP